MKFDLVVGVDPGTIHHGFAFANKHGIGFGSVCIRRFNRTTTFESFMCELNDSPEFLKLRTALVNAANIGVLIEVPDRRIVRNDRRHGKLGGYKWRRLLKKVIRYWRQAIESINPIAQIVSVDSLTWQRKIVPDGLARGSLALAGKTYQTACCIAGRPVSNDHCADAICLVEYGIKYSFINGQFCAPSM